MASARWTPLFEGPEATDYVSATDSIVEALDTYHQENHDFANQWGAILLNAYIGKARSSPEHLGRAEGHLQQVIDSLPEMTLHAGLHGGYAGVGWILAHVGSMLGEVHDEDFEELDDALLRTLADERQRKYDLIGGAIGFGVYFLERLPHDRGVEGLSRTLAALRRTAEVVNDRATWYTPSDEVPRWQRRTAPRGYYNLGVAHGVAGVVGLLAQMCRRNVHRETAEPLLRQSVRWILDQRLPDGSFSSWVAPGMKQSPARIAWCYGELGIAATLLSAGQALNDDQVKREACEIARRTAARTDRSCAKDAMLCHGSCGNAHLFNRLYQATGDDIFERAARSWYAEAKAMRRVGTGIGGYHTWRPYDDEGKSTATPWSTDPTFLSGSCGIALAFSAATTGTAPDWDRLLLVDSHPTLGT